jgi:RNA-binding protein Musashi
MRDKNSGKARGFGFVTFYKEQSADKVMVEKKIHKMKGKWVDCKRAVPSSEMKEGEVETSNTIVD